MLRGSCILGKGGLFLEVWVMCLGREIHASSSEICISWPRRRYVLVNTNPSLPRHLGGLQSLSEPCSRWGSRQITYALSLSCSQSLLFPFFGVINGKTFFFLACWCSERYRGHCMYETYLTNASICSLHPSLLAVLLLSVSLMGVMFRYVSLRAICMLWAALSCLILRHEHHWGSPVPRSDIWSP